MRVPDWTDAESAALAAMILAGRSWDEVFRAHPDRDPDALRRHAIDGCMALNLPGRWPQIPDDDDRFNVEKPMQALKPDAPRPTADQDAAAVVRHADPLLDALGRQHRPGLYELKIRRKGGRFVAKPGFEGSTIGSPLGGTIMVR